MESASQPMNQPSPPGKGKLRQLATIDPGHFHAALFQREMLPGIAARTFIYAPYGRDLAAHIQRIAQFNSRSVNPTCWTAEIHAGGGFWEEFKASPKGQIAVLSGNNRGKIRRIHELVEMGYHVLADKPWIIEPEDLPELRAVLDLAAHQRVVAYDAMTQRFEITCLLQRELVQTPEVFGSVQPGTGPAVTMESVHYLLKEVAGVPSLRPPWFFDVGQQGEALADVGTHLVDLVQWTLFPGQAIDPARDLQVTGSEHWPTRLSLAQFQKVTGDSAFPSFLSSAIRDGGLDYYANQSVDYRLKGVPVRLVVRWDFQAGPGARDSEFAAFRGTRAAVEVRQGREQNYQAEVYVVPNNPASQGLILAGVQSKLEALRGIYPGLACAVEAEAIRLVIPPVLRVAHEAHFGLLVQRFLDYVDDPTRLPAWERDCMLAKYSTTTQGVGLARRRLPGPRN